LSSRWSPFSNLGFTDSARFLLDQTMAMPGGRIYWLLDNDDAGNPRLFTVHFGIHEQDQELSGH